MRHSLVLQLDNDEKYVLSTATASDAPASNRKGAGKAAGVRTALQG